MDKLGTTECVGGTSEEISNRYAVLISKNK